MNPEVEEYLRHPPRKNDTPLCLVVVFFQLLSIAGILFVAIQFIKWA